MGLARIVLITHPEEGAEAFARGLVEARLAACVNLLHAQSVYRWRGALHSDPEALLVVKTMAARLAELERHLAQHHPYDVPECVALEPAQVEERYQAWLSAEVSPP
jgi:periplasmic divalent cation tolerance protein